MRAETDANDPSHYGLAVEVAVEQSKRAPARPLIRFAQRISASHAVWSCTLVAAAGWTAIAAVRESLFIDKRQDLGNFTQAVWATAHGHFLQVTEAGGTEVSRLGIHVDPVIAFFAPLWRLWPSPLLLLTVEAVALALGAVPLFWLARKHLPLERDAALLAIAYLLCPTVDWNAFTDFHSVALAVPALLFAIWYLDEDRLIPFAVAAGVAALCQEQIGLMIGCLGLWYAWQRRRLGAGLAIAAAGFAVSAIDFLVVLPHFSGGSPYAARFGGSPTSLLRDLFTHPLRLARQVNTHDLAGLLPATPVIGYCFGSTIMWAATPQIALLLLSHRSRDWLWGGINVLLLVPFIYAATALALGRVAQRSKLKRPWLDAGQVLVVSVGIAILLGPFGIAGSRGLFRHRPGVAAQQQAVSLVPAGAPVSATNHLALPLAARRYLYVFPVVKDADWVLVDSRDASLPDTSFIQHRTGIQVGVSDLYWQPRLMRSELQRLERSPNWRLVYHRGFIYVFRRNQV